MSSKKLLFQISPDGYQAILNNEPDANGFKVKLSSAQVFDTTNVNRGEFPTTGRLIGSDQITLRVKISDSVNTYSVKELRLIDAYSGKVFGRIYRDDGTVIDVINPAKFAVIIANIKLSAVPDGSVTIVDSSESDATLAGALDGHIASPAAHKWSAITDKPDLKTGDGLDGGGSLNNPLTIKLSTPSTITATSTNTATANVSSGHTHAIDKATTAIAGIVKLNDTLISDSTTEALTAAKGKLLDEKKANKNITLSASIGLKGGGDLSISRSFSIDKATAEDLLAGANSKVLTADVLKPEFEKYIPYKGASKTIDLNGQIIANPAEIRVGDGANNQYQSIMFGNYKRSFQNENYGAVHNARYVADTLLRYTAISTYSADSTHISSLFASDKDAILRLGEVNYPIALKHETAIKSLKIETGTGLLGGGDLSANRTLSIDKATIQNVNTGELNKVVTSDVLLPFLAARVADTRTINAGTGLSGGGDLSANRTLSIDKATIQNVNTGELNKVVTSDVLLPFLAARVADTRTINAGTGLSGGGDLSANRTLSIDKATVAELLAGINNKVVTADILFASLSNTKSENGYTKLPNGLIFQWGKHTVFEENKSIATYAAVFPISFPNACLNISLSKQDGGGGDVFNIMSSPSPNKTGFTFGISDKGVNPITGGFIYWFAIGY